MHQCSPPNLGEWWLTMRCPTQKVTWPFDHVILRDHVRILLTIKTHVKSLCKKDSQKIWALARQSRYLNQAQKSVIFKSVKRYQFNYCSQVVKSAQKRSFFWSVFSCIRTEYRKIRTTKKLGIWTLFTLCSIVWMLLKAYQEHDCQVTWKGM